MAQQLNKANEARAEKLEGELSNSTQLVASLQAEIATCRETVDKALSELKVSTSTNKTLEERIQKLLSECEKQVAELAEVRTELRAAVEELGIVVPENISLKEQLQVRRAKGER